MTVNQSPQELAARAQRAMQEGRYDDAHADLAKLRILAPQDGTIRLMTAYAHRAQGQIGKAKENFEAAIRLQPREISFRGVYADWLSTLGEHEKAIVHFDAILAEQPDHLNAKIDRLLSLARTPGRPAALQELALLADAHPHEFRIANNLALFLREDDRISEAVELSKRVLSRDPVNRRAKHILARSMYESGNPSSKPLEIALAADPDNLELKATLAQAAVEDGRTEDGIAILEDALDKAPDWLEGYGILADMKRQTSGAKGFATRYETALSQRPDWHALRSAYAALASRVEGHERALEILGQGGEDADQDSFIQLAKANSLSELKRFDEAEALFAKLDFESSPEFAKAYLRFLTRTQRFDEVIRIGNGILALDPAGEGTINGDVWPYIAIAMRKLDDPRWAWLEGDRRFIQTHDISSEMPDIEELADTLRKLHVFREQPIAQSVRGGTQTGNILFRNASAPIQTLVNALRNCVREYIDQLPEPDPNHPLLGRPRENFRFSGSWSIRLTEGGFHANHIHTHGDISSAFYVALPQSVQSNVADVDQSGWLMLGEPASELETGLEPIRAIRPEVGRLVLFPSTMWHGTRPFEGGERLTCAFDVRMNSF
ncbi:2OG-Fe(II) oxygenase family protein [Pontixanthobacter luteolus]|uniref:2OG-Fe(II) oxygenase family protein n=1 Tax=Pontixanthobacter luteolus TaxID=295089 RepID=UPI0023043420|nr:tetratricopeptide repeat protein [Pontixanthobacter luteolus]